MIEIQFVSAADQEFWFALDHELSESEFLLKVRDRRGYIIKDGDQPVGIMRYNLIWDIHPFLTLIYVKESDHGKGIGRAAMLFWENEMRELGYQMVMTSTQVNEQAQHFYRKLGYRERGALYLDGTPFEQAQEMFLLKTL